MKTRMDWAHKKTAVVKVEDNVKYVNKARAESQWNNYRVRPTQHNLAHQKSYSSQKMPLDKVFYPKVQTT